jgi:hypothetical protein
MTQKLTAVLIVIVHLLVVVGHVRAHSQLRIEPRTWEGYLSGWSSFSAQCWRRRYYGRGFKRLVWFCCR